MSQTKHQFLCPSCGEEGEIALPDEMTRFECPAECGADFIKYKALDGWAIRCVVQPVFADR